MKISSVMDWIEITRSGSRCKPQDFLPDGDQWKIERIIDPVKHYDWAGKCVNGSIVMHGANEAQGMRMIVSGEPMRYFRDSGHDDMELVKFAHTDGRKPTRLDLTIDMVGNDVPHPRRFTEAIDKDEHVTRARYLEFDGQNGKDNYTQYIGSPNSDKRGRIYDYRALHLNMLWDAWTRCEIQLNQDYARAACQDVMRNGIRDTACVWWRSFCDFPTIPEFQEATNPENNFSPERVPRKETNWQKWLLQTVYQSCVTRYTTTDRDTVDEFYAKLGAFLGKDCT